MTTNSYNIPTDPVSICHKHHYQIYIIYQHPATIDNSEYGSYNYDTPKIISKNEANIIIVLLYTIITAVNYFLQYYYFDFFSSKCVNDALNIEVI